MPHTHWLIVIVAAYLIFGVTSAVLVTVILILIFYREDEGTVQSATRT